MPGDADQAKDPSVDAPEEHSPQGFGEHEAQAVAEGVFESKKEEIREIAREEVEAAKPGEAPAHDLDVNLVSDSRNQLTDLITSLTAEVSQRPREGAEVTLAVRKLQEARMWLGVAKATAEGHDPWQKDVKKEDK